MADEVTWRKTLATGVIADTMQPAALARFAGISVAAAVSGVERAQIEEVLSADGDLAA